MPPAPSTLPLSVARGNLVKLRSQLKSRRVHAYIVPHADEHQSEYLAPSEEKLAFVSNFTGSAGTALVFASSKRKNLLWTDNRYFIQAESQLSPTDWSLMKAGEPGVPTLESFVSHGMILNEDEKEDAEAEGNRKRKRVRRDAGEDDDDDDEDDESATPFVVGINSRVCTMRFYEKLMGDLAAWNNSPKSSISPLTSPPDRREIRLELIEDDLVDRIWEARPPRPCNPILDFSHRCGKSFAQKIARVETLMKRFGTRYLLLSALDDIAWLLNARGSDIVYNPLFFSYALHDAQTHRTTLFTDNDASALTLGVGGSSSSSSLSATSLTIAPYSEVFTRLSRELEGGEEKEGGKIWLDINTTNCRAMQCLLASPQQGKKPAIFRANTNPVKCEKSAKTKEEVAGMRDAQFKDAISFCRFFHRVDRLLASSSSSSSAAPLDEWTLAEMLEEERAKFPDYRGKSFETISAFGPNAAVVHYKVESLSSARKFDPLRSPPTVYLLDAGGHYDFGTTDTTRTIMLRGRGVGRESNGKKSDEEEEKEARRVFTHVLKAHIALAETHFPRGTHAHKLDSITRAPLWAAQLDYKHGTGHGVMTFGSVHELPPLISAHCPVPSALHPDLDVNLVPGVCVTDEPGHYAAGRFGFRYESLLCVEPAAAPRRAQKEEDEEATEGSSPFCRFEYLTPVPVCDISMVDPQLLTQEEKAWLNRHHRRCRELLSPFLERAGERGVLEWLARETREV